MKAFRDPFDDEELDRPAIKSTKGGSMLDLPVIAAGEVRCVHCGEAPDFQHPCNPKD